MSIFGGDDQLLKSVRITDNIKVEVYQQGRRRKYALFYDGSNPKINNKRGNTDNTKSTKYDVSLTDDQVIEESLKSYNDQFSDGVNTYKVVQDPYKEIPQRIYGSVETPYYLNNGCKLTIEWYGKKPNEYFSLGTSSTAKQSEDFNIEQWKLGGYKGGYIPRWRENENITLDYDSSGLYNVPPFSIWVVPTGEIEDNYRDSSKILEKRITIYLPKGIKENGYDSLVWNKNGELGYTDSDDAHFAPTKDEYLVPQIIQKFKSMVTKLHGIADYDLKLCSIDTEYCKIIDYKSPLEAPNNTPQQSATNDTPPGPSHSTTRIKLNILGLFDGGVAVGTTSSVFEIKAKTDMPAFTVWAGEVPKTEEIDVFDDLSELDPEYTESSYEGKDEATMIFEQQEYPSEEVRKQTEENAQKVNDTPYVPGKNKLDMIPGIFKGNGGMEISCCQVHGKPINVKIADALLDLIQAAKNDGVTVRVNSGFRPDFYPNIKAKSDSGVLVEAQSQEELYNQNCSGGVCNPDTAKPGRSKHGSGIAIDFNCGSKEGKFKPLNESVYTWMIKNSWKFGFVRTVPSEEWHFEYWPEDSKSGPYAKIGKSNKLYWSYLGLNNLQSPNWT